MRSSLSPKLDVFIYITKANMSKLNLREIGPLLYWCEGTKSIRQGKGSPHQIEFVSSDPLLIKIFLNFLRNELNLEEKRLRGRLQIHEDNNEEKVRNYWSKITGIPPSQFQKPIVKKNTKHRFYYNRLKYGTFIVRYTSTEKYKKLIEMINELKENLLNI